MGKNKVKSVTDKRVDELNNKNKSNLTGYGNDVKSSFSYVATNFKYFGWVGIALIIIQGTFGLKTLRSGGSSMFNPLISLILSSIVFVVLILFEGVRINILRAIAEKIDYQPINLKESSMFRVIDKDTFEVGIRSLGTTIIVTITTFLVTLIVGVVLGLVGMLVIFVTGVLGGGLGVVIGQTVVYFILVVVIMSISKLIITPFTMSKEILYVYYGRDLGFTEVIKISFNLGFSNYGKLFVLNLKTLGLNIVGTLMLGLGLIYTIPVTYILKFETYDKILGRSIIHSDNYGVSDNTDYGMYGQEIENYNEEMEIFKEELDEDLKEYARLKEKEKLEGYEEGELSDNIMAKIIGGEEGEEYLNERKKEDEEEDEEEYEPWDDPHLFD